MMARGTPCSHFVYLHLYFNQYIECRRFKEAREMGEKHSIAENVMSKRDPNYEKSSLRETQVIIVPFCEYFDSFQAFEGVIQAINEARKDARDFVTDASVEKMRSMEREWKYVQYSCGY